MAAICLACNALTLGRSNPKSVAVGPARRGLSGLLHDHRKIGPNFNPEVGFVERTDCICDCMDGTLKPRPHMRGLRELNFGGFLFHVPDTHHVLMTQEWKGTFRAKFNNGSNTYDEIVERLHAEAD